MIAIETDYRGRDVFHEENVREDADESIKK